MQIQSLKINKKITIITQVKIHTINFKVQTHANPQQNIALPLSKLENFVTIRIL